VDLAIAADPSVRTAVQRVSGARPALLEHDRLPWPIRIEEARPLALLERLLDPVPRYEAADVVERRATERAGVIERARDVRSSLWGKDEPSRDMDDTR
jgi:hypothetical protein